MEPTTSLQTVGANVRLRCSFRLRSLHSTPTSSWTPLQERRANIHQTLSQSKKSQQYIFSRRRRLNYARLFVGGASCRGRCQTSSLSVAVQPLLLPSQQTTGFACRRANPRWPDVCVGVCASACLAGITCHGASAPGGGRVKQLRRDWGSSPRHRSDVSGAVASSAMCCYMGWGVGEVSGKDTVPPPHPPPRRTKSISPLHSFSYFYVLRAINLLAERAC